MDSKKTIVNHINQAEVPLIEMRTNYVTHSVPGSKVIKLELSMDNTMANRKRLAELNLQAGCTVIGYVGEEQTEIPDDE